MSQKNFTNATGNWSVRDDGNISYVGGAVGVQELDIESGRLTAYADPIPEYVLSNDPGMGILWRNPVTGTILGIPGYGGSTMARSTDNGATWQYLENPIDGSPYIEQINNFELGPVLLATNTDGSMTLFGTGWDNFYTTDDGLSWIPWTSMPKGKLEGPVKILYDEGTDRWRVLGAVIGAGALKTEYEGSDPNVYIGGDTTFNNKWSPQSRPMIFDDGKVLFKTMSSNLQSDNRFVANMILLRDSSSFLDDNIASRYDLDLTDTNYSAGVGRPSFEMGKDTLGNSMAVCAYTRANNTLGIRTTSDGQTWTDLSDQLVDLPLVDRSGYTTVIWLEERQEWYVFVSKLGSTSSNEPGSAYVFKASIAGDITSLADVTRNALVVSRVQQAVGTDIGVWFVTNHYTGDTIEVKDITETNPPDLDLYWDGKKLATEPYVDNLVTGLYTDLSNTVKIETQDKQSIGGSSIQLNTENVELGFINNYGTLAYQTNQVYLSEQHATFMSTPQPNDPNQFPTSISMISTKESTYNGRTTLPFTTTNYKPHRFRDKVEIDLDPTGDFDAANKKYVDSVAGGDLTGYLKSEDSFLVDYNAERTPLDIVSWNINDTYDGFEADFKISWGPKYYPSIFTKLRGTFIETDETGLGLYCGTGEDSSAVYVNKFGVTTIAPSRVQFMTPTVIMPDATGASSDAKVAIKLERDKASYFKFPIQASDFLDADGKSIIGVSEFISTEGTNNISVGTLDTDGDYSTALGMKGPFGGFVYKNSVGVGMDAKASEMGVAVGWATEARKQGIAVGYNTRAWGDYSTALGPGSIVNLDHEYSVAIGKSASTEESQQVMFGTAPDAPYGKPLNLKTYGTMQASDFLDADGNSIIGAGGESLWTEDAGGNISRQSTVKVEGGLLAAQPDAATGAFSAGLYAGSSNQGQKATALGYYAGSSNQAQYATALGYFAGRTSQSEGGVAIGHEAGNSGQGFRSVAIGYRAGKNSQSTKSISIGNSAGESSQRSYSIAIGMNAGQTNQGGSGIIISSGSSAVNNTTLGHIVLNSPNGSLVFNGTDKWEFAGGPVQATDFLDADSNPLPKSATVRNFVTLTQAQYDLLPSKNGNTIYFIKE